MLASLFSRSNIHSNYELGSSRTTSPAGNLPSGSTVASFAAGLWKVQTATHKTNKRVVSVWSLDKRMATIERLHPSAKERVLEVLKLEAQALSRLRHPCLLEVVEPLEDSRFELIFATEPLMSSLAGAIPSGSSARQSAELDETEIRKGVLQLNKALEFLHISAKLIHTNISPETILVNSSGDWKLSGLGLTISLNGPDGQPTRWEFPSYDNRIPSYIQRSFDYIAPEYALDEILTVASDMYSLGCLVYAVHNKASPPFKNHGSLGSVRDHAGKPLTGIDRWDPDLRTLLNSLITRHPNDRLTTGALPGHSFFSSLAISTLNFLERSTFATKTREEKISFMKGLRGVLDRFSDGLRTRKILPSLLEEMKDPYLLPYLLPNVFEISKSISSLKFTSEVLPGLKPLFSVQDPPQNMVTLLDNLPMLQSKTDKSVFKEQVLPLVYSALESEHAMVQERALACVPSLCDTIDYAEVQSVMFTRVAVSALLPVRKYIAKNFTDGVHQNATLICETSQFEYLCQHGQNSGSAQFNNKDGPNVIQDKDKRYIYSHICLSRSDELVDPQVMMATLGVQEAMGQKVDRDAVATHVLPQLWSMSIGPLLNVEQFQRFMSVIKNLGDRVEREHNQFLRDSQRVGSPAVVSSVTANPAQLNGESDFASLVGGAGVATTRSPASGERDAWEDDVWGDILSDPNTSAVPSPAIPSSPMQQYPTLNTGSISVLQNYSQSSGIGASRTTLGAKRLESGGSAVKPTSPSPLRPPPPPLTSMPTAQAVFSPPLSGPLTMQPLQPSSVTNNLRLAPKPLGVPLGPNYNIPTSSMDTPSSQPPLGASRPNYNISMLSPPISPSVQPSSIGLMPVMTPATNASGTVKSKQNNDWGDFDPLR